MEHKEPPNDIYKLRLVKKFSLLLLLLFLDPSTHPTPCPSIGGKTDGDMGGNGPLARHRTGCKRLYCNG